MTLEWILFIGYVVLVELLIVRFGIESKIGWVKSILCALLGPFGLAYIWILSAGVKEDEETKKKED